MGDLQGLGIRDGDLVVVHASLRASSCEQRSVAWANALCAAVGLSGALVGYVSWDCSPYDETLNGGPLGRSGKGGLASFRSVGCGRYGGVGCSMTRCSACPAYLAANIQVP